MQIADVVNDWCRERNAATRATWWGFALLLAFVAGIGWITYNGSALGLALIVGGVLAWNWFAPKPEQLVALRRYGRDRYVPDSLLGKLADATTVPAWVKAAIADALKKDGVITFETIFEMDGWLAHGEDRARRETGQGFQKIAAFGNKPDNTTKEL